MNREELDIILAEKKVHCDLLSVSATVDDFAIAGRTLYVTYKLHTVYIVVQWRFNSSTGWQTVLWNGSPCNESGAVLKYL